MSRTKSQLRHGGMWPDGRDLGHVGGLAPAAHLTVAAHRLAEAALEELGRLGVVAALDGDGRARFRATRAVPPAAKLAIERYGDLVQALLRERDGSGVR